MGSIVGANIMMLWPRTYKVSTEFWSPNDVQFSGAASPTWYSQVPLVTFQNWIFGRIVEGNEVAIGKNDQDPIDAISSDLSSYKHRIISKGHEFASR